MNHISQGHRSYRVALLRRQPSSQVRELDIEYIRVRANSATHAMLAARYVSGAAVAMSAERVVQ